MIFLHFLGVWIRALMSGARVPLGSLIGMKLRRVQPALIVDARIRLVKAGLSLPTDPLEAHYLAGGDVINVVNALIAADKANIELGFQRAAAIDLAGRDVFEAVKTSVNPKVIDCPDPSTGGGSGMLDAVAKDGIRLLVKARVTVRANIERLVGGAKEDDHRPRRSRYRQRDRLLGQLQGRTREPGSDQPQGAGQRAGRSDRI